MLQLNASFALLTPSDFDRLSEASVHSLQLQGGPMSPDEVAVFEINAFKDDAVKLRYYDDDGKVASLNIKPITVYKTRLNNLLIQQDE